MSEHILVQFVCFLSIVSSVIVNGRLFIFMYVHIYHCLLCFDVDWVIEWLIDLLQLEAQKNTCACARDECVAERERGIEARTIESDLLQGYIGNLQTRCAILEARFEDGLL